MGSNTAERTELNRNATLLWPHGLSYRPVALIAKPVVYTWLKKHVF